MKIAVLGAGGWGTALAILLYTNGHTITLWEYDKDYAVTLDRYRENFYYLPKVLIPKDIHITNDLTNAVSDQEIILISTPTQFIRSAFTQLKYFDFEDKIVLNVSKGIENETLLLVNEIIADIFLNIKKENIACMSGPSHAEEVSMKMPTVVVCAATSLKVGELIQSAVSNKYFRVYTSSDVVGVELGGALKNVIAIASGIAEGAGFGDNTKAAIMTRGINEIMRLGIKLGARMETFFGLSGIGDLIVTCSSQHSRNRFIGEQIGKGKTLNELLSEMKMVAEGIATSKSALMLAERNGIEVPIVKEVNEILFGGKSPVDATGELMQRDLKSEI